MSKIKNFWKNLSRGWRWFFVIVLVIVAFGFLRLITSGGSDEEIVVVGRGNLVQKISVSGKVESAQQVELAFETGGTVHQILRQEGELVKAGELIASLNTSELSVRLARGQAALEKARLALATLTDPPETTERLAAENELALSREASVKAGDDGTQALNEAMVDLPTILSEVDSLVRSGSGYLSNNTLRSIDSSTLIYKAQAEDSYWVAQKSYDQVKKNPTLANVYDTVKLTAAAIKDLYTLISYVEEQGDNVDAAELASDKLTLSNYTNDINSHLSALLLAINDIEQTNREVIEAEENLRDLLDGAAVNDVATSQLDVRQAELDVQDTRVQIAKQQIRAPFDGVVARNDLELGETISASQNVVSIISDNDYEIVSRVPEAEISKIKVGDTARITLDAYPPEELQLEARVAAVNLAEVIVDGVATYKVTMQFATSSDPQSGINKIKSGMTANVEITGASKNNVLTVPQRAITSKNGDYFVWVRQDKKAVERPVEIGLRGSDGQVEIISGLSEGDQVMLGLIQ